MSPRLLIASNNRGKIAEFRALLSDCGWELVTPADIGLDLEVQESGRSYEENARIKACAFVAASGLPSVADDSGLEVDALGGEPGPLHHVLGWDGADDQERIAILLRRMAGQKNRRARFKAAMVVAFPGGEEIEGEGAYEGFIGENPAGDLGFGYDPVFVLPEQGKAMAQLSFEEKNQVSHRARAAAAICDKLREASRRYAT